MPRDAEKCVMLTSNLRLYRQKLQLPARQVTLASLQCLKPGEKPCPWSQRLLGSSKLYFSDWHVCVLDCSWSSGVWSAFRFTPLFWHKATSLYRASSDLEIDGD